MRNNHVAKEIQYIRDVFAPENASLKSVRENLDKSLAHMQIGADEGKILQFLATIIGAEKIVEIGSLAGYSSIWMARALPDNGRLFALELDQERARKIEKNYKLAGVDSKTSVIIGEAKDTLPALEKYGPFDMVFIDADKSGYCEYLDWAEKNIRKGGLIVGDNTFLFGTVHEDEIPAESDVSKTSHKIMREFNKRLADPKKYMAIMLPTEEGMAVAQKLF